MSDMAAKLEWVERVLGVAMSAPSGTVASPARISSVKLGKARLGWLNTRRNAIADIGRLRGALASEFGGYEDQRAALPPALKRLDELVNKLNDQLDTDLDDIINQPDVSKQRQQASAVRGVIARFDALVANDAVMIELDGNEVLPDMRVTGPLLARLAEIGAALG